MSWMWATIDRSGPVVLGATVAVGQVAFINGGNDSELWGRIYQAGPSVERSVAAEFVATANACVTGIGAGSAAAVVGEGLLAVLIRGMLPTGPSAGSDVVIDTTGSAERIRRAVAELPRLGHLILVAPPRTPDLDLATYRDLHVRALRITGVPWVSNGGMVGEDAVSDAVKRLAYITPGQPGGEGLWYAVNSPETE